LWKKHGGRIISKATDATDGKIDFDGQNIVALNQSGIKDFRRQCQIIFQDPYSSLNPRYTVFQSVAEPLQNYQRLTKSQQIAEVSEALERAELRPAKSLSISFLIN